MRGTRSSRRRLTGKGLTSLCSSNLGRIWLSDNASRVLVEGALLGLHSCMAPASLSAPDCRSSAAAVAVVAGGAF